MARLGLALDIGTTNIAGFIIDFDKPQDHFEQSLKNSQSSHGLDVITRLTYMSASNDGQKTLQKLLINDINNLIFALCKKIRINRKRISKIIASGNALMLNILLGQDISGFSAYPYESKLKDSVTVKAENLGIKSSKTTELITLPIIAPYLGADVVAGILFANNDIISSRKFLIDLGTNAEIVFGNKEALYAASAAAGPAFKSKNYPLGSNMISMVSRMLECGEVDKNGNIKIKLCKQITQEDIRALQLAKAAIRSAIEILLEKANKKLEDIHKILLSGLFGEKINREDALFIGLIPTIHKNYVRSIGNSSLKGAKKVLLDPKLLDRCHDISHKTKHIELSLEKGYQEKFLGYMGF